jgi:hypothetical protein
MDSKFRKKKAICGPIAYSELKVVQASQRPIRILDVDIQERQNTINSAVFGIIKSCDEDLKALAESLAQRMPVPGAGTGESPSPDDAVDLARVLLAILENPADPDHARLSALDRTVRKMGRNVEGQEGSLDYYLYGHDFPEKAPPNILRSAMTLAMVLHEAVLYWHDGGNIRIEDRKWIPLLSAQILYRPHWRRKMATADERPTQRTYDIYTPLVADFLGAFKKGVPEDYLKLPVFQGLDTFKTNGENLQLCGYVAGELRNLILRFPAEPRVLRATIEATPEALRLPAKVRRHRFNGEAWTETLAQYLLENWQEARRWRSKRPKQDFPTVIFEHGWEKDGSQPAGKSPLVVHLLAGTLGISREDSMLVRDPLTDGTPLQWALLNGEPLNPKNPDCILKKGILGGKDGWVDLFSVPDATETPRHYDRYRSQVNWSTRASKKESGLTYLECVAEGYTNLMVGRRLSGKEGLAEARAFVEDHAAVLFDPGRLSSEKVGENGRITCGGALHQAALRCAMMGIAMTEWVLKHPDLWELPVTVSFRHGWIEQVALLEALIRGTRPWTVRYQGWDYADDTTAFAQALVPALEKGPGGWARWRQAVRRGPMSAKRLDLQWEEIDHGALTRNGLGYSQEIEVDDDEPIL